MLLRIGVCGALAFAALAGVASLHYGIAIETASRGIIQEGVLRLVQAGVAVHDPCTRQEASLEPADAFRLGSDSRRIEEVFIPGRSLQSPSGRSLTVNAVHNARIVRGKIAFGYQPYEEPRLSMLREKFGLDRISASSFSELETMVLVRSWARSLYRRQDFQEKLINFNALELPTSREREESGVSPGRDPYDPCHFFPLLYVQLMASLGYEARVVSVGHAVVEVWSNEFEKWVLMDAEFDHHFEKKGVPLSVAEMLEENYGRSQYVQLVAGRRFPMPENPTMAHLKLDHLTAKDCIPWFNSPIEIADLRNDWLSNHYFPGHPQRSEINSLVYVDPRVELPGEVAFRNRMRPTVDDKSEVYWTLNQAEISFRGWTGGDAELGFATVTPNFDYFEIVVDGKDQNQFATSLYRWRIHEGMNTLVVRPVNKFGVRGIESTVELSVSSNPIPKAGPRTESNRAAPSSFND